MCIAFPITSKIKGYPFEVTLPKNLPIKGVVLSDQVKNLDFSVQDISFICKVPNSVVESVQKHVVALIG